MTAKSPAVFICETLDAHLSEQELTRRAVSVLADGASFEAWLAFETRIVAEGSREQIERLLPSRTPAAASRADAPPRFWFENEYRKIDFSIRDAAMGEPPPVVMALEFKLIHNNKNWNSQLDAVWEGLFPTGSLKSGMSPEHGRHAVVGLVGLAYREPGSYTEVEIEPWRRRLDDKLVRRMEAQKVTRGWVGRKYDVHDAWIRTDGGSFFQLQLLSVEPSS